MSGVNGRVDALVDEMNKFDSWEEKYAHIIKCGKGLDDFPAEHRNDSNLVKGCQSQVWIFAKLNDSGLVEFYGDSDAAIVRGIVNLLLRVYNGISPQEILEIPDSFIDRIGLRQHLSMSRANGLNSMLKQLKLYAFAFQTQIELKNRV